MTKYVYQIQGILEDPVGKLKGLRVLVCDLNNFDSVDVPVAILDKETAKYIEFRLRITTGALNMQRLPNVIQNKIRAPLGAWLDRWVSDNFYAEQLGRKTE